MSSTYRPLPHYLTIGPSKIEGLGLIAKEEELTVKYNLYEFNKKMG
jgi:hypothetical protein